MNDPQRTPRADRAAELFEEGYNCCQAVLGAFVPETGLEWESAMLLASSMGGGIGRMREVCGAVSGMVLAAGLLWGYADPKAKDEKAAHYALVRRLCDRFREENRSIVCRELLAGVDTAPGGDPEARTPQYYKKRPCKELVAHAATILEQEMAAQTDKN